MNFVFEFRMEQFLFSMWMFTLLGVIILFIKFLDLRKAMVVSVKDMVQLLLILALFRRIENPEQKMARLLKMTPEEVLIEMEKGHLIDLISGKAEEILCHMKEAVPFLNKGILLPLEAEYGELAEKRCK